MRYEIYDVANVKAYPNQENEKETTARPAIVIEDLQDEVLLCPVTKQVYQAANYKYTIYVDKDSDDGKQMGLTFNSIIVLDRFATLKKIRLSPVIGSCTDNIIVQIENMLDTMRKNGDYI